MKIKALLYSIIATFAVAFTACDDDLNSVGNNILPDSDSIDVKWDTVFNIKAETYSFEDKIYARTTNGVFGDYTDDLLGRVKADFLCELRVPQDAAFHKELFAIDSVQVNLLFLKYSGDSLAPMGITAYEVDKKYLEENYYTNIDPTEYSSMSRVFAKGAFAIKNTAKSGAFRIMTADADTTKGWEFFDTWKSHPEYFKNSKTFKENVLKGLYITPTYGTGAAIDVSYTTMDIYYRFNAGKKAYEDTDSIGYGLFSLNATEEITQMNHVENKIDMPKLNAYTDRTFMKTPAGLCTKLNIPIGRIVEMMGDNKNLNAATFKLLGFSEEEAKLVGNRPTNILLIHKDSLDGFFADRKNELGMSNNANTISVIERNIKYSPFNSYDFGNIANIISHYIDVYKSKGTLNANTNLELLMLPVTLGKTTSSSGATTSTNVYHLMSPTSAILRTGSDQIKMPLIFSKYNSQKDTN